MDKNQLHDRVLNCPRLPSLPSIAIEVIELCRRQDINIKHIATTISNDPALSSKILKTVNSSFYGLSQSVSTISHALVILGLNAVRTLALGFSLIDTFRGQSGKVFDMVGFWQRCLYSAVGARAIAQAADLAEYEEAFLGGLLKDLGMMAMLQTLQEEYVELIEEVGEDRHDLWRLERERLGTDHAQIGAALADRWKLPDILIAPIRHHEQPDKAPSDSAAMVRAVALGSQTADVFLDDKPANLERFFTRLHSYFGLDNNTGERILQTVQDAMVEMGELFNVEPAAQRDVQSILAEANETLLQLSLQTQQNASQLENRNRQLQEQMERDSLTGAANRGRFDQYLEEQFDLAVTTEGPLSVIFLDADRFKSVNDTHGHQAGDQVLVALARLLMEEVGEQGLVGRYGGEEFAIILPQIKRKPAAHLAERIRAAMEATAIDCGEGLTLHITISLGVASMEVAGVFNRPQQLVAAADKAVYAAKNAGRNRVRVFVPRKTAPQAAQA